MKQTSSLEIWKNTHHSPVKWHDDESFLFFGDFLWTSNHVQLLAMMSLANNFYQVTMSLSVSKLWFWEGVMGKSVIFTHLSSNKSH